MFLQNNTGQWFAWTWNELGGLSRADGANYQVGIVFADRVVWACGSWISRTTATARKCRTRRRLSRKRASPQPASRRAPRLTGFPAELGAPFPKTFQLEFC